jgi:hypothetical protein
MICEFFNIIDVFTGQNIAGNGFEPLTSGLWARRATELLYPAIKNIIMKISNHYDFNAQNINT